MISNEFVMCSFLNNLRKTKFKYKNSKNLKYTYLSSKKKLPQWDIRISSVSVVSVPLSRAQPLIIIDPLPSAKMYVKYQDIYYIRIQKYFPCYPLYFTNISYRIFQLLWCKTTLEKVHFVPSAHPCMAVLRYL